MSDDDERAELRRRAHIAGLSVAGLLPRRGLEAPTTRALADGLLERAREARRNADHWEALAVAYLALVDARNGTGKAAPCSDCGAEDPTIVNDVLAATGGDVSASPDRALPDGWVHCCNCQGDHAPPACRPDDANRYHQRLGAKWMCEALVRWLRTSGLACAADIERRWEDDAFWRPETTR